MDTLALFQPLASSFIPTLPTVGASGVPLLASQRVGGSLDPGVDPTANAVRAGEAATQSLLMQVVQLLSGLLQNQAGSASGNGPAAAGGCCAGQGKAGQGGDLAAGGSGGSGASGASQSSGGGSAGANLAPEKAAGRQVERQGKKIDASIADNFDAMVEAAKKDGVDLRISSGYRSRQEQEVLYQKYLNGTGNLAAKPGTSNHESGLAIDFENTPGAFAWLKKNSTRFGLKNLPSEPWHYSVDGR